MSTRAWFPIGLDIAGDPSGKGQARYNPCEFPTSSLSQGQVDIHLRHRIVSASKRSNYICPDRQAQAGPRAVDDIILPLSSFDI